VTPSTNSEISVPSWFDTQLLEGYLLCNASRYTTMQHKVNISTPYIGLFNRLKGFCAWALNREVIRDSETVVIALRALQAIWAFTIRLREEYPEIEFGSQEFWHIISSTLASSELDDSFKSLVKLKKALAEYDKEYLKPGETSYPFEKTVFLPKIDNEND
jgi:hypothetical protein